jgi:arylsulfatase A-like enzyme
MQQLSTAEVTLAEALKPAGYVSASIGKWHLGGEGFSPIQQGFDLNIAGNQAGSPASYFYPYRNDRGSIPGLETGRTGEYLTDRLAEEALKFIDANRDKPFFLYLPHYAVHIPLAAKQELVAEHEAKAVAGKPQHNPVYAAMIESVDESVGKILSQLEKLGIAERTVIFFMSDNGGLSVKEGPHTPATSNAPLRDGKGYLYEGGIREPLIICWPGVAKPGTVCDIPVSSIDFFPTILEMAGVRMRRRNDVDGLSLVALLKRTGTLRRNAVYWHYPHYSNQGGKPGGAIRSGDFKLIEFYEDNRLELYNLRDDIGEQVNLAGAMPRKAAELRRKLHRWRKAVNAQMMKPNPDFRVAD